MTSPRTSAWEAINGEVFQDIISQTFIPEIDLFASRLNAKTAKFVS